MMKIRKKTFPLCLQHDSMQCGVACLQMICKYYGKDYSTDTLSHYCFTTNQGVSLLGISEAAEQLGFDTVCGRFSTRQLSSLKLPCILHWNQNHFVILYKIKKRELFYVADPSKGLVTYKRQEFESHCTCINADGSKKGVFMLLEPNCDFHKEIYLQENQKRSFSFLFGYFNQYRKYFGQIIIGLLLGCLLELLLPFLTQAIVDVGIKKNDIGLIWLILLGQLMITVGRVSVDFVRRWLLLHISMRIKISLVSDFFIKLLKLPMQFFDTKLMGDLIQRMNDHSRVEKFLTNQTLNIVFSLLSFMVFGFVLFLYNHLIFAIFLMGSLVYGVWISVFLNKRKILDYTLFEHQGKNSNHIYQFLTSMQEIKLQDCEQRRRWEWEDVQADLFQVQMRALKLQQVQEAGSIFINEVKNMIVTVVAAAAVINGNMTLGMMLAVQYIIGQLNNPVEQLMHFFYVLQDVKISLERINEIHDIDNENSEEHSITSYSGKKMSLSHVSFKYDPHSKTKTISDVSIDIPEGKVTAIVGASGSGKTTLIKLLLGFYPVASGQIYVGDENMNKLNLKWWRKHCGAVMQEGVIFYETISRNIAVGDAEVDNERLVQAAQIANIHEYVMSLPLKYDTKIGRNGLALSQGQKQRILIARAVYKNPDFIFLDEATNSLDAKNEKVIVENLNKFYEGRTVVVVAHRLSTVKNADQIIVLDVGKVVEVGNHETLAASNGVYYNLVKNQLELGN